MNPLNKTGRRASGHGRRRKPITWRNIEPGTVILIVGTVILIVLTALTLVLTAHNRFVTEGVAAGAIVLCGLALLWFGKLAADPVRRDQAAMVNLAHKIEGGPGGVVALLGSKDSPQSFRDLKEFLKKDERERLSVVRFSRNDVHQAKQLLDELEEFFTADEGLSVVRLDRRHLLETPPGVPEDGIPESILCLKIVGQIGWGLEEASGLSQRQKEVARELRDVVSYCLQQSEPLDRLRQTAVDLVTAREGLTDRLVLLANASPEALQRDAGKWLLDLLVALGCTFGVLTQEGQKHPVPPIVNWEVARRYADDTLSAWLSEKQLDDLVPALRSVVSIPGGLDLGLLKIRCAVLAEAAKLGRLTEAQKRLLRPDSPARADLVKAAALEVRWLIDCRVARAGVLDRLALVDKVTPEMFAVLLRDLELEANRIRDLFDWLSSAEFSVAEIIFKIETKEKTVSAIGLHETIGTAVLDLLREDENSARKQKARIAAERCYRECLILNPALVPGDKFGDWMMQGYGGFTLFENISWRENLHVWNSQVAEIESPEDRWDAKVAITCLFLEAWWWWGDQLRLPLVEEVLGLAKGILQDQPDWIDALEEFDRNYVPEFGQRAGVADRWHHVANALNFLASTLNLRQGQVPDDRVLTRIYACWCSFNGDAAEHTDDLEAADRWFGYAADACGDGESGPAMRAFSNYERADVRIPSDINRSRRLITETKEADAAISLGDLGLQAYITRMHGDIRWTSGDLDGAFDAYGQALLLAYVYQVDQESEKMPPSEYTYRLYDEQRARLLTRLDEASQKGRKSAADAALARINKLFGPYWALGTTFGEGDDRLAGIAPPLPTEKDLMIDSGYVRDALKVKDQLLEQIAGRDRNG